MSAIVSSTLYPSSDPSYGTYRSWWSSRERLEQTRQTVASLVALGMRDILVADNSGDRWEPSTERLLEPARVRVFSEQPARNKGISELKLLLEALPHLPPDEPILKVSGRYILRHRLVDHLGNADLVGRLYRHARRVRSFSNRAYVVRDASMYRVLLERVLSEIGSPSAVVGPRSFLKYVGRSLGIVRSGPPSHDAATPVEIVFARILTAYRYSVSTLQTLGVEGYSGEAPVYIRE